MYARFAPTRYFCWAPFDTQTDYAASSTVNGRELTAAEFRNRYRRSQRGFDNRSPQHVIDMLRQVEEKRAALGDKATVVMKYRVNGKELREWRWP
ncbi:MAG: SurA N-terminal domain-containing protein [Acidobacteriota bacterium]|nr:SurA N-terminal domain-containing protein [Acidobacteriota bacterium]